MLASLQGHPEVVEMLLAAALEQSAPESRADRGTEGDSDPGSEGGHGNGLQESGSGSDRHGGCNHAAGRHEGGTTYGNMETGARSDHHDTAPDARSHARSWELLPAPGLGIGSDLLNVVLLSEPQFTGMALPASLYSQ